MLTFHVSMGVSVAQRVLESECNVETSDSAKMTKSRPRVNGPSDRCFMLCCAVSSLRKVMLILALWRRVMLLLIFDTPPQEFSFR